MCAQWVGLDAFNTLRSSSGDERYTKSSFINPLADGGDLDLDLCIRDWLLSGPEGLTIHICTYIIGLLSLQGQKLPRKSFRVPFLRQGSFFKINERNISKATELC